MSVTPQRADELRSYVRLAAAALGDALRRPPFHSFAPLERASLLLAFGRVTAKRRATAYAKDLVRACAKQYGVPLPTIKLRINEGLGSAGQIYRKAETWYVDLSTNFIRDRDALVSTVAHEFAHIALDRARVRLNELRANEELTDVAAVLAGFGPTMRRASKKKVLAGPWYNAREVLRTLGYLSKQDIQFVARIRERIASKAPVRRYAPVYTGKLELLPCLGCGAPLPVPSPGRGWIIVVCHGCTLRQRVFLKVGVAPLSFGEEIVEKALESADRARFALP